MNERLDRVDDRTLYRVIMGHIISSYLSIQ